MTMLRRYLRYWLGTGRVPSLLAGEYFRTEVTSYGVVTLEPADFVPRMQIFFHHLGEFSLQLIARYTLEEHDLPATARLLHCNDEAGSCAILVVLDQLSEILGEAGLMQKINWTEENSCRGFKATKS